MPIKVIEEQNKVVLTQAQATLIKGLKAEGKSSVIYTIRQHCEDPYQWSTDTLISLKGMPIDDLLTAFYRPEDITIEQTVEEQLLERYEAFQGCGFEHVLNKQIFRDGFKAVLDIIGMKVKGINA